MEERGDDGKSEKSTAECNDILERSRSRFNRVVLTFREPTLNKNLPEIVACAKKSGYPEIMLQTNGRMLSYGKLFSLLVKNGLNIIAVSLHGHTKDLHESLARSKGSFEQTIKGLKNAQKLREAGLLKIFTINATVTKSNFMHLSEMYDFFMSFNPDSIVFNMFNPKGPAADKFSSLMPKYSDVNGVLSRMHSEGRRKFGLVDFPLCTVKNLSSQWSCIEDYHIDNKSEGDGGYIQGSLDGKHKLSVCSKCRMNAACHGVVPAYIKKFGEGEFKAF
jgi:cyclic pyranopterin phosphate synthase